MRVTCGLILLALSCHAQCISAGGPATSECGVDQYFSGGTVWGPDQQPGLTLGALRYGVTFSYRIPVDPDSYFVTLTFVEPNKTAAGQRTFTVAVNGQVSDPLDVFALGGAGVVKKQYFAIASTGIIQLDFKGVTGNALVSRIEIMGAAGVKSITLNPVLDGTTYRPQVRGEAASFVSAGVFMLQNAPTDGNAAIYVNGLRANPSDYALHGATLTFAAQIMDTDVVLADYFYDKPLSQ